jgi:wyosine [tRNA(Phe)-imidazoG37] synthetase (radical SAM superfamily)
MSNDWVDMDDSHWKRLSEPSENNSTTKILEGLMKDPKVKSEAKLESELVSEIEARGRKIIEALKKSEGSFDDIR